MDILTNELRSFVMVAALAIGAWPLDLRIIRVILAITEFLGQMASGFGANECRITG